MFKTSVFGLVLSVCASVASTFGGEAMRGNGSLVDAPLRQPAAATDALFAAVEQRLFESLPLKHQQLLLDFAQCGGRPDSPVAVCFAPGTDENLVGTFQLGIGAYGPRFNLADRWAATALDPTSTGTPGIQTVITYSFVPDGTPIPNGVGEGAGVSNLFAYMNGIYGSPAAWQPIYTQIFDRWSQLTGIKYAIETNDDGAQLVDSPGVPGVRGDVRLAGKFIDGNSGILAYNYYPQSGDMVIDTGDNFFTDTSGSSLRLRNVLAHEHGHGMGLAHVCPVDQTKLMEPFVSTNYDGPRHDDARAAQTLYGDVNEPNNTAANANSITPLSNAIPVTLGTPAAPIIPFASVQSISNSADEDWYKFTVTTNRTVTISLHPVGVQYANSSQNGSVCTTHSGSCCPASFISSTTQANLNFELRNSSGSTLLASANLTGAGLDEVLSDFCLSAAGTYSIRVFATGSVPEAQEYTLTMQADLAPFRIRPATAVPTLMTPGTPATFEVAIAGCGQSLVAGSARLRYRFSGGSFQSAPLTTISGSSRLLATIPAAACGDTVQFYIEATGSGGTNAVSPAGAPASFYSAAVGTQTVVFSDNFETDKGWTVANDAGLTDGAWERGIPAGEGGRYDPPADFDGSGQCYLTGNRIGNADIDGATTRLTSPTINLAGAASATVSYARWFRDSVLGDPDRFTFEVSNNNGSSWTVIENIPDTLAWNKVEFPISIPLTNLMKFRVSASDLNPQTAAEAAFDAFVVTKVECVSCPCVADFDNSGGTPDAGDIDAFFSAWLAGDASSDADCSGGTPDASDIDLFFLEWLSGGC